MVARIKWWDGSPEELLRVLEVCNEREVRIYRSIKLNGFSLAKASNELGLSPKTISILGSRIREKLDFSSGPSPEDGQEISPVSPRRPRSPSENAEVSIPSPESEAFSQPG